MMLLAMTQLVAQSTNIPLNEDYYHLIDRYETKSGRLLPGIFTALKPYQRNTVVQAFDSLEKSGQFDSRADAFNRAYVLNDSWEWSQAASSNSERPVLKNLYRKKSDFAHVSEPDFDLHVNPVLHVGAGHDSRLDEPLFVNTRGVEIRGIVDGKIGFYTLLTENQLRLPSYARAIFNNPVVPHEGFWKNFKETGVDFFHARGYIDFNVSKHVDMQLGQDRLFVGNGMRSLIFSDFSAPHLFWRTQVRVWKLNYLFQVNRMVAQPVLTANGARGGTRYPEKYVMFHHASINIGKKLNLGVFESVIFSPKDSVNNNTFDLSYLNPVIFFRAIETQFGSAGDNVILGADFKWLAAKKVSVYGQFVLDEFLLSEVRAGNGWWANKFGAQLGAKYVDAFGVANLDLQGELNVVRPFTYSHHTQFASYTNYFQPIAHPFGANFSEWIGVARYQPLPRLNLTAKAIWATRGRDRSDTNVGGDPLKNSRTRENDFGNEIGQGLKETLAMGTFTASYQIKHNLFLDVNLVYRQSAVAEPPSPVPADVTFPVSTNTALLSGALRWNIAPRLYDY
jgi:hypothetical protein